jgi:peptidoglycan/xylan/chitin deacetylase (PgdA/CDA1 family)
MARAFRPLALAYHGIADVARRRDPSGLFVCPDDLRRHIDRLRAWGYELVSFRELADRVRRGFADGAAALTFDDGVVDNLETLAPILRETDATATVFVVSEWLGRPYPWATWTRILNADELNQLADEGIEIGSHTASHPDLATLAYDEALDELQRSKSRLEELLERPVTTAAYPYGRASAAAVEACRDAGYVAACRATGAGRWDDPHQLPRQDMDNGCSVFGLRLKRDDLYEPLMRLRPARAARRLVRSARTAG